MQFDCNPPTLFALRERLKKDPRMIRCARLDRFSPFEHSVQAGSFDVQKLGDDLLAKTRVSEYSGTYGPTDTILRPKTRTQIAAVERLKAANA
jgi:hypothetical protein